LSRSMHEDDTNVYRVKKVSEWGTHYEGPYMTMPAAKARMAWNRGYDELVLQILVGRVPEDGTVHDVELVWEDYDD